MSLAKILWVDDEIEHLTPHIRFLKAQRTEIQAVIEAVFAAVPELLAAEKGFSAGDTYALPRDMGRAEALDYWLAPAHETFAAEAAGLTPVIMDVESYASRLAASRVIETLPNHGQDMLIALFERAYLVAHKPRMNPIEQRRWNSWDDYMREWCRRDDFYNTLPTLLRGEDAAFQNYLRRVAQEERGSPILAS